MAHLKPSDFITLRKKRMDWTMAGTHRQWIYAFKLTVLGKWEIDNWKRCEFVKVEILAAWFCGNMNKINILVSCSTCFFFILAAHTHSPNPLKTLQRTIRNITISIRTPDSNVSHTLSPSSLPWVPNEKKTPRLWLDLGFLDENGHEFLDLAVLPGGVSPGKSHRGPELQATTELTRVGFIWATCQPYELMVYTTH
jgi:hypothetical protein